MFDNELRFQHFLLKIWYEYANVRFNMVKNLAPSINN